MMNVTFNPVLADSLTNAQAVWLVAGSGALAFLAGCLNAILGVILKFKALTGRKPPIDEDLARYSASVEKLKLDLAKLPDAEKFNKLAEQLSGFATLKQLAALEISFDQQQKESRRYVHDFCHDTKNELGARINALELGSVERGERLAAVEREMQLQTRRIEKIDTKLDQQVDRIADKVEAMLVRRGKS